MLSFYIIMGVMEGLSRCGFVFDLFEERYSQWVYCMILGRSSRYVVQCFLFFFCRDIFFVIIYFLLFVNLNYFGFDEFIGKVFFVYFFALGCVVGFVVVVIVTFLEGKCMVDVGVLRVDLFYELVICVVIYRINRNCVYFQRCVSFNLKIFLGYNLWLQVEIY